MRYVIHALNNDKGSQVQLVLIHNDMNGGAIGLFSSCLNGDKESFQIPCDQKPNLSDLALKSIKLHFPEMEHVEATLRRDVIVDQFNKIGASK